MTRYLIFHLFSALFFSSFINQNIPPWCSGSKMGPGDRERERGLRMFDQLLSSYSPVIIPQYQVISSDIKSPGSSRIIISNRTLFVTLPDTATAGKLGGDLDYCLTQNNSCSGTSTPVCVLDLDSCLIQYNSCRYTSTPVSILDLDSCLTRYNSCSNGDRGGDAQARVGGREVGYQAGVVNLPC